MHQADAYRIFTEVNRCKVPALAWLEHHDPSGSTAVVAESPQLFVELRTRAVARLAKKDRTEAMMLLTRTAFVRCSQDQDSKLLYFY